MGARESRFQTAPLLFSSPRLLSRQLPAIWLAGVFVAVTLGLGVGVRLAVTGDLAGFLGWCAGVAFIPSLALAAGVWTGGEKLFEVLYLLLWYAGPMNRIALLDYMGAVPTTAPSSTAGFAIATVVLLAAAVPGHAKALRG